MRKLKRSIAKENMRRAGFEHIFKKSRFGEKKRDTRSLFSRYWKKFVFDPFDRKAAKAALRGA